MRPRDVLARNLEKLMAATPGLSSLKQITAAGGGSNGNLHRIRRKTINTGVDNVAALAAVYGLQPWELLVPTLAPEPGSSERPIIKGSPTWPFASVPLARFMELGEAERAQVESELKAAIARAERADKRTQALHAAPQQAVTGDLVQTKPTSRGARAAQTPAQLATIFPGEGADNGSGRRAKPVPSKRNGRRS